MLGDAVRASLEAKLKVAEPSTVWYQQLRASLEDRHWPATSQPAQAGTGTTTTSLMLSTLPSFSEGADGHRAREEY